MAACAETSHGRAHAMMNERTFVRLPLVSRPAVEIPTTRIPQAFVEGHGPAVDGWICAAGKRDAVPPGITAPGSSQPWFKPRRSRGGNAAEP